MSCQQQNLQLTLPSKQLDDRAPKKKVFMPCVFFPPFPAPKMIHLGPSLFSLPRYHLLPPSHLLTVCIHPITKKNLTRPQKKTKQKSQVPGSTLKWLHDYWHLLLPGACMLYVLYSTRSIQYTTLLFLSPVLSRPPLPGKAQLPTYLSTFSPPLPSPIVSLVIRF